MNLKINKNKLNTYKYGILTFLFVLMTLLIMIIIVHKQENAQQNEDPANEAFHSEIEDPTIVSYEESKKNNFKKFTDIRSNQIQENYIEKRQQEIKEERDSISEQNKNETKTIQTLTMEASAYTSNCDGCSGITKSGYPVHNTIYYNGLRIIASDNSVIPLYSIVRISYGNTSFDAIVLDSGGAIKNHKIDILMESRQQAISFGRRTVTVTILRYGG